MSITTLTKLVVVGSGLVSACAVAANGVSLESSEMPATLRELFTSEGCSSSPPADAWIGRLKSSPNLWDRIVPIVYHVDYWDRLGWRDRFAKPQFADRQRSYGSDWGTGSVYTPAFVVDGREWNHWSDGAIPPPSYTKRVGKLRITVNEAGRVSATFTPVTEPRQQLRINVAFLAGNLESQVSSGENSGRKLRHDFGAIATTEANLERLGKAYSAELTMPAGQTAGESAAVAARVTSGDGRAAIQATGGWLRRY